MRSFCTLAIVAAISVLGTCAWATEPLHDGLVYGDKTGPIFPTECCWLKLPDSPALTAMRRDENCSAIGGPVGEYRYQDGKLWLIELRRCGGTVPIREVFPDLPSPAVAVWLTGDYIAKLNWLCRDKENRGVYELELHLHVAQGNVVSVSEQRRDRSDCK